MSGPQEPQYPQDPNYPPQQPYGQQPQQPYGQQPYGQQQYPQSGYPPQHQTPTRPPRQTLWQRVGARALRRPAPRFGVTLAGVGVTLVVLGVLVWGFSYIQQGAASGLVGSSSGSSDSRHYLGFVLALIVVLVGYALAVRGGSGPLVTAGVAASALGVPVAIEFLTLDTASADPFNTDAVVWISVIVYLVSYLFVRGARGHTFYLGLTALFLWEYAVENALPSTASIAASAVAPFTGVGGPTPSIDTTTIAGVSLVFAVGYYLIAWALDRTGRRGMALPFVLVGIPAMLVGIGSLAPHTKQVGTGIVLLLVGLVLCRYGARYERRFTAWFWGLLAAAGAVVIATKFATTGTSLGITMVVLGVVFAVGAAFAAQALSEPDDMAEPVTAAQPGTPVV